MLLRNPIAIVFSIFLLLTTLSVSGQQQVDMDKAMADNPGLYTGRFTRIGVGFTSSSFSYGTGIENMSLSPLRLHLDFGKRVNKNYGTYFTITTDLLLKEVYTGSNLLNSWGQVGMHVGGIFFIKGGRSYIAPELGMGIIVFDYESYSGEEINPATVGIGTSLKYGYDRHITGNMFLGGQLYISYTHTWDPDVPDDAESVIGKSFIYGASFNMKFGK